MLGFFPRQKVAELGPKEVLQFVNKCFSIWGLPGRIKIDNGLPLVNPHQRDMPTLTVLWWIGLGIKVQQNDPGCPQQNGTVEGLQGICNRWVNPQQFDSVQALQEALDEVLRIQMEVYRIPGKKHKTRLSLHPELKENPRKFNPEDFSWQRVKDYLADQVWTRTVSVTAVSFFNQKIYVGKQFAQQEVTLTYDPIEEQVLIRSRDGNLIRSYRKPLVTEAQILEFAGVSKN
jgi:hypothetical protein